MSTPKVQVIVVAYNSGAYLQRCIDALAGQTFRDFEAVIWDNASNDGAADAIVLPPNAELVRCNHNLGFSAANNRAAELSRSEYIALLNPDAFAEAGWLERLVKAADETGAEAIASLQLDASDEALLDGAGDCMSIAGVPWRGGFGRARREAPAERVEVFSACGAAALYRRGAFERLGGFEEAFFCYCEDVDLGFRLRRAGGRCILEPRAVVRHVGGASSGGSGSAFAEYHGARNRLWTFFRNMPWWLMPVALPAHLLVMSYVLLHHPKLMRVRLKGIADAFKRPEMLKRLPSRAFERRIPAALSWSPLAAATKAVVTRPLRRGKP